jgi:hypothetical protein
MDSIGLGKKWDRVWKRGHTGWMLNRQAAQIAAAWLSHCPVVEDWGCGHGLFKDYLPSTCQWIGVDGCSTSAATVVADLTTYRSSVAGLHMRGVLEHNTEWETILDNALASYTQRAVIVMYLSFVEKHQDGSAGEFLEQRFTREEIVSHLVGHPFVEKTAPRKNDHEVLLLVGE